MYIHTHNVKQAKSALPARDGPGRDGQRPAKQQIIHNKQQQQLSRNNKTTNKQNTQTITSMTNDGQRLALKS